VAEWTGVLPAVMAARTQTEVVSFQRSQGRPVDVDMRRLMAGISNRHVEVMRGELAAMLDEATRDDAEYRFEDSIRTTKRRLVIDDQYPHGPHGPPPAPSWKAGGEPARGFPACDAGGLPTTADTDDAGLAAVNPIPRRQPFPLASRTEAGSHSHPWRSP
jgi:hypothetical protein